MGGGGVGHLLILLTNTAIKYLREEQDAEGMSQGGCISISISALQSYGHGSILHRRSLTENSEHLIKP